MRTIQTFIILGFFIAYGVGCYLLGADTARWEANVDVIRLQIELADHCEYGKPKARVVDGVTWLCADSKWSRLTRD